MREANQNVNLLEFVGNNRPEIVNDMMQSQRVCAVIPAYNEEKTIGKVILNTEKSVNSIVVVDDGSSDLTALLGERLGVTVLRHEKNQGKGAALRTGIEYAKSKGFEIVVTLDADSQHDAMEIPKLMDPIILDEADVVIGVRPTEEGIMPRDRAVGNKILDAATNSKAGKDAKKLRDTQSGFRAYSSKALQMISFTQNGMAVESQTFIDAVSAGLRIKQVPISTTYEGIIPKRNPFNHFSHVLDYIITRTIADSPLLYLGFPGLVSVIFGVLAGLRVVQIFLANNQIAAGTALIAVTLIIIGSVLIASSIIIKLLKIQSLR